MVRSVCAPLQPLHLSSDLENRGEKTANRFVVTRSLGVLSSLAGADLGVTNKAEKV